MNKQMIAVIGGSKVDKHIYKLAQKVGRIIAENNCILICGGKTGVMEAAAKGAHENNGLTIGILPGSDKNEANPYIEIAIPTNLSHYRNALIAQACDLAIAIDGSYGTLSEIAFCLNAGKKVLGLSTHKIEGIIKIKNVESIKKYL